MFAPLPLSQTDPDLWAAIQKEDTRQQDHIELIASENYTSPAVMEAQGSQLTNKYAEGGHLTHGMALNMSGKWFNAVAYGLNEQEEIDYDRMEALAREHKPKLIIA
ncbi:MAG: hypothetical protein B7X94_04990, partial [Hydrogenophilales bacterium 17-62-8]